MCLFFKGLLLHCLPVTPSRRHRRRRRRRHAMNLCSAPFLFSYMRLDDIHPQKKKDR
jgi:hypothetical protein